MAEHRTSNNINNFSYTYTLPDEWSGNNYITWNVRNNILIINISRRQYYVSIINFQNAVLSKRTP